MPPLAAPPTCDYLLFTAISAEKKAVRDVAAELGLSHTKGKSILGDYVDLQLVGNSRVLAVATHMGPFSSTGSAAKALQWLAATQARAVISVGMAFGTRPAPDYIPRILGDSPPRGRQPGEQEPGDILVSESLLPYDYKIVRCAALEGPSFDYSEVASYPSRPQLLSLFKHAARLSCWHDRVHFGPLLSGASRIHCARYRDDLCAAFPDRGIVMGGDMEGIGLLASSDETESRWIIVKGISDFADSDRNRIIEKTRPVACYNAVQFVLMALLGEEVLRAQP